MINKVAEALSNIAKSPAANNDISSGQVGQDFSSFMQDAAKDSVNTLKEGELMSIKGISGEADLTDVVSAVNSAEATLQLVTTLRDRIIQAYQEIIRMPI
jgi:flagellar hook-basal body complex protein FliE